jgi:hypothetical protein
MKTCDCLELKPLEEGSDRGRDGGAVGIHDMIDGTCSILNPDQVRLKVQGR